MINADKLYYNGKIITVNNKSSIEQAFSVNGDRFTAVGCNRDILKLSGPKTEKIDLKNKTVIPGLNEGHCHVQDASLSEIDEEIPNPRNLGELIEWIHTQTEEKPEGSWIVIPKFFFSRIDELRLPTLEELDFASPNHPVFLNGSYGGVVNTYALRKSGIDPKKYQDLPPGVLAASDFVLLENLPKPEYSYERRLKALKEMILRYNKVGITSLTETANKPSDWQIAQDLHNRNELTARILYNYNPGNPKTHADTAGFLKASPLVTYEGNEWIRMGHFKILLDGGILTGTARLRKPWGEKAMAVFGIKEPSYCGIINYKQGELNAAVETAYEYGWSFTAHVTGDGGMDMLLNAYEELNKKHKISSCRFSLIHGNFFYPDILERCRRLNILIDAQPAWFYKDSDAMNTILGEERIRYFHPYKTIINSGLMFCAGSDHMIKFDSKASINPYNPFLGMYTMITHKTERGNCYYPEESISRIEALKAYTVNNAFKSREENIKGSIEPGKLADFVILNKDILSCTPEELRDMTVESTIMGGRVVYQRRG